jgi:NADH-quinone oxidoreductase subunit N
MPVVASLGLLLLVAGFAFKMAVVPFHAWSPDTYQGAPSPFVAFLSVAPKVASALVLFRLLDAVVQGGVTQAIEKWSGVIALLSVLSMLVGNFLALAQRDVKRMLAYSGIAHMGYLLLALVVLDRESLMPVIVYLLAYVLMNAGAFTVVAMLYSRPGEQHLISDLSGYGYRYPLLGACLAVCMLSLGGIPPTVGFFGKYLVFLDAVGDGLVGLAVLGVLASLVGVFYYLRVVYVLYMKAEETQPEGLLLDVWGRTAAVVAAVGTLALGIWPWELVQWLLEATAR